MRGTTNIPEVSVLVRKDGKILFVQRTNTGWMDGFYAMPGGHLEVDENFTEAAAREALEEVGVAIDLADLKPLHTLQRFAKPGEVRIGVLFEANKWAGEPRNMEPERHGDIIWLDEHSLPYDKIIPFQAAALQSLQGGTQYSEMGWKQ